MVPVATVPAVVVVAEEVAVDAEREPDDTDDTDAVGEAAGDVEEETGTFRVAAGELVFDVHAAEAGRDCCRAPRDQGAQSRD